MLSELLYISYHFLQKQNNLIISITAVYIYIWFFSLFCFQGIPPWYSGATPGPAQVSLLEMTERLYKIQGIEYIFSFLCIYQLVIV